MSSVVYSFASSLASSAANFAGSLVAPIVQAAGKVFLNTNTQKRVRPDKESQHSLIALIQFGLSWELNDPGSRIQMSNYRFTHQTPSVGTTFERTGDDASRYDYELMIPVIENVIKMYPPTTEALQYFYWRAIKGLGERYRIYSQVSNNTSVKNSIEEMQRLLINACHNCFKGTFQKEPILTIEIMSRSTMKQAEAVANSALDELQSALSKSGDQTKLLALKEAMQIVTKNISMIEGIKSYYQYSQDFFTTERISMLYARFVDAEDTGSSSIPIETLLKDHPLILKNLVEVDLSNFSSLPTTSTQNAIGAHSSSPPAISTPTSPVSPQSSQLSAANTPKANYASVVTTKQPSTMTLSSKPTNTAAAHELEHQSKEKTASSAQPTAPMISTANATDKTPTKTVNPMQLPKTFHIRKLRGSEIKSLEENLLRNIEQFEEFSKGAIRAFMQHRLFIPTH